MASSVTNQQQVQPNFVETIIDRNNYSCQFIYKVESRKHLNGYVSNINVPTIQLKHIAEPNQKPIELQGKPFAKFIRYLGIGKREFMQLVKDKRSEATQKLADAYPKSTTERFKLLFVNDRVARITSDDYIGIPHSFVQSIIERRLKAENIPFTKNVRFGGTVGEYRIDTPMSKNIATVGDEISKKISYFNRNSGDHSLKFFGGGEVLTCSNGMISERATEEMRLVHKLELPIVEKRIEQAVGSVLEKLDDAILEFIKLREITVSKEQAKKKIYSLPIAKYLQDAIWERLFTPSKQTRNGEMDWDGTMYGLFMASTFVGSHSETLRKSKNVEIGLNEDHVQKLSTVEMFTTDWDAKEKALEASGATKMEVKSP